MRKAIQKECRLCSVADCCLASTSVRRREDISVQPWCYHYRAHDVIYHEATPPNGVYCVNAGLVKIYRTGSDGRQTIVRLAGPGQILDFPLLQQGSATRTTAEAVTDVSICFLERSLFCSLIVSHPDICQRFMTVLGREFDELELRLTERSQHTVRQRVATLVLKFRQANGGENRFQIPLTRNEMAEMIGSTNESVTRSISEFRRCGLISVQGHRFETHDAQRLAAISRSVDLS